MTKANWSLRYKEVVLFRQQALRARRLFDVRDAIFETTSGHVVGDLANITPVTESDEYSQFGENFDDLLSSYCNEGFS